MLIKPAPTKRAVSVDAIGMPKIISTIKWITNHVRREVGMFFILILLVQIDYSRTHLTGAPKKGSPQNASTYDVETRFITSQEGEQYFAMVR